MGFEDIELIVNQDDLTKATEIFGQLGLTVETAINLYLKRVVETGDIQFALQSNDLRYIEKRDENEFDDVMTKSFQKSVDEAIEESRAKGLPIAKYDPVRNTPYLEYSNGRREYFDKNDFPKK